MKRIILLLIISSITFGYLFAEVTANDILKKNTQRWDITFDNPDKADIKNTAKVLEEVAKVAKEINKISVLLPRLARMGSCGDTGCNLDSVKCDAVTEKPVCPDGSVLNPTRDMCQKDPDIFKCPTGYTYDSALELCAKSLTCPYGGTYVLKRHRCEVKRIWKCPSGYTEKSNGICVSPPICSKGGIFDKSIHKCVIKIVWKCKSGWLWNSATSRCERNPTCPSGFSYSNSANKCVASFSKTCSAGYHFVSSRNRCERNPTCPSGSNYNSYTKRCERGNACPSGQTYNRSNGKCMIQNVQLAIGRVGDNYLSGYCSMYSYTSTLYIANVNNLRYFTLKRTKFDDYIKVEVNGHVVRVGPYGGDRLKVITASYGSWGGWTFREVQYSASGFGNCELGTSWDQYHNINVKPYLRNGVNTFKITVEVAGGGEAYAYFGSQGPGISCRSGYCSKSTTPSYVNTQCPSGYAHDSSGRCYQNPTCPGGGRFDSRNNACYKPFLKHCSNGTFDSTLNECVKNPNCYGGILDAKSNKCQLLRYSVCPNGTVKNLATDNCEYSSSCTGIGTLNTSLNQCKDNKIPLRCPVGTDAKLDVCYDKVNYCQVSASFPKYSTLKYSNTLKICAIDPYIVCAKSLTWTASVRKCEAVPICMTGVYQSDTNKCFDNKYSCPIDKNIPCVGTQKYNHWCSPWKCNSNKQCGYAFCPNNMAPKNTSPWMLRSLLYNVAYTSNSQCVGSKCDIVVNRDISYCGKDSCPKGFGVYEKNNRCYKDECPNGSFLGQDNKCYIEKNN